MAILSFKIQIKQISVLKECTTSLFYAIKLVKSGNFYYTVCSVIDRLKYKSQVCKSRSC